jgi:hypothetical protein
MKSPRNVDQLQIIMRLLDCNSDDDLIPCVHDLLQYREDTDRILLMLKANYRLPK